MLRNKKIEFVKTGVQLFMHTCCAIIKTYISDRTGDKMYNILVVDDERIHREGLIMLLEKICPDDMLWEWLRRKDRKSTRLNSSHVF